MVALVKLVTFVWALTPILLLRKTIGQHTSHFKADLLAKRLASRKYANSVRQNLQVMP
jgi:hypothetical protein